MSRNEDRNQRPWSSSSPPRAALFITCLVDLFFPQVGLAAARLLRRLGVDIEFPGKQTCCGQPAYNAGYVREPRAVALHFLEVFESCQFVVAPSGSCVSMVREHYPDLFSEEADLRERFSSLAHRTFELSEFITEVLGLESTGSRFPHKVTYHDSCHTLRGLGLRESPRRLIRAVEGIELLELPDAETCCGFGGIFAVKYPEISMAMLGDKIRRIEETGAEFVVATDTSCLMHIGGALERRGSSVRTLHLAELLES